MTDDRESSKHESQTAPRIVVVGLGGAGGNAVNNMIQSKLTGVEILVANTDAQALQQSLCERCIQMGRGITKGLGAGARPDIGRAATEEALDEILTEVEGASMVFITAGMGGGTGTGGAPVLARAAREAGVLTVGVVTKPFRFEGARRMRLAEAGISELTQCVDTLIVISNQNLFRVANEKTTFADAFKMADDVLHAGVRGMTDLMFMPGLINLDFADIRSVMTEMGKAIMGAGEAEGEGRALAAAEAAISSPLLDEVSIKGARGLLISIIGGPDLTLFEVDEAANHIRDEVDPEANIIFGSTFDQGLEGRMRVSVVATGIEAERVEQPKPATVGLVTSLTAAKLVPEPAEGCQVADAETAIAIEQFTQYQPAEDRPEDEQPVDSKTVAAALFTGDGANSEEAGEQSLETDGGVDGEKGGGQGEYSIRYDPLTGRLSRRPARARGSTDIEEANPNENALKPRRRGTITSAGLIFEPPGWREHMESAVATEDDGEAEEHLMAALALAEQQGPEGPHLGEALHDFGSFLFWRDRLDEAAAHLQRAVSVREAAFGSEHAGVAPSLNNLAEVYWAQNRQSEALPLLERALAITEASDQPDESELAVSLNSLASLYEQLGRLDDAKGLYRRALKIEETRLERDPHCLNAPRQIEQAGNA